MLTVYLNDAEHRLIGREARGLNSLDPAACWIDLVDPDDEERRWVNEAYGLDLPSRDSMVEIEASSRFFEVGKTLHVRSYFLEDEPIYPRNLTVAFIIGEKRLVTLRERRLAAFDSFKERAAATPSLATDATDVFLRLFETKIDRLADLLEGLHAELEALGDQILREARRDLEDILARLARAQNVNDKTRLSLHDTQRSLSFLQRARHCSDEQATLLHEILGDVDSLSSHCAFLAEKMEFLMDATLGLINIEQNQIIKIFSIAAVVFLPPTLVASIYGMNFRNMPELSWTFGYPMSLLLMVAAGAGVYWYFKHKRWL